MKLKPLLFNAFIAIAFIASSATYSILQKNKKETLLVFPENSSYIKEWKRVDSLANKGLHKSALELVEAIYAKATRDNNAPQIVKSIIHRMKFEQFMEEYSLVKALNKLNEEIAVAKYPVKPILHSMLAESYWKYYQENRWNFYERSQTANFDNNDITTWNLKTILNQVIKNYQASLQNTDSLKRTSLNIYDDVLVITQKDTRKFRSTLYDFLAHRAVDFYMNEEPDLTKPTYNFEIKEANAFADYSEFIKIHFESKDSFSLKFYAIKTLQELTQFYSDKRPLFSKNKDVDASLIDVELKRLLFVKNKSTLETKDDLYLQALKNLEKQFVDNPASAEINYNIAQFYVDKSNKYNPLLLEENSTEEAIAKSGKWLKKQAVELCDATIINYPKSYGAINCIALKAQIQEHSLDFITEKVNLPNQVFKAFVTYKNVKNMYVRVAKLPNKDMKDTENESGENLLKEYLKINPLKEWQLALPDDGDFQTHTTEIKIPELPLGSYVILIGTDKKFSTIKNAIAYTTTAVSNISYVNRRMTDGSYDFYVQHRLKGEPLKGVAAQLYYQKYIPSSRKYEIVKAEKYTSDDKGFFNVPASEEYRNLSVEFSLPLADGKGVDRLLLDQGIYQYRAYEKISEKKPKTFFFLDRGIYRPGQTVYFKGIMITTDG